MTSEPSRPVPAEQPGLPEHPGHPEPAALPERRGITVRRAPKFVPFLVAGGVLGILAAAVVAWAGPGSADYDRSTVFGFFAVLLAVPGVVLGGIVALVLDRASVRGMERAVVEAAEPETAELAAARPETAGPAVGEPAAPGHPEAPGHPGTPGTGGSAAPEPGVSDESHRGVSDPND